MYGVREDTRYGAETPELSSPTEPLSRAEHRYSMSYLEITYLFFFLQVDRLSISSNYLGRTLIEVGQKTAVSVRHTDTVCSAITGRQPLFSPGRTGEALSFLLDVHLFMGVSCSPCLCLCLVLSCLEASRPVSFAPIIQFIHFPSLDSHRPSFVSPPDSRLSN